MSGQACKAGGRLAPGAWLTGCASALLPLHNLLKAHFAVNIAAFGMDAKLARLNVCIVLSFIQHA